MDDPFETYSRSLEGPGEDVVEVTPSNDSDLPILARGLWIGIGGNVKVTAKGGGTVTFTNVPGGIILPVRARRVHLTGTTADEIVAIW